MQPIRQAIIISHPDPGSFTHAIAERYRETVEKYGNETVVRDLYALGFDPVLRNPERLGTPEPDVLNEWDILGDVDVFVLVYPIWFGAPPAMLKGYIDRVFGAGRSRGSEDGGTTGKLEGRHLVSLTLSGSYRAWLDEKGVFESLRNVFDRYLAEVFCLAETHHYHFDGIEPGLPERDYRFHLAGADDAAANVLAQIGRGWSKNPNAGERPIGF